VFSGGSKGEGLPGVIPFSALGTLSAAKIHQARGKCAGFNRHEKLISGRVPSINPIGELIITAFLGVYGW